MKSTTLYLITILFLPLISKAQLSDSAIIKKLTINGFCLCRTTITSLKQANPDLQAVDVEEMDLPKKCIGQDSRYIAGSGYSIGKQPGMVFQKDPETDFISKIRLTRQFKGPLPNGKFIDLSNLQLKDLLKLYPQLKDKWGSRGCSDYWKFSDDTISFYVKIDPRKQPQYPVDEAYYLNKPVEAVDLMMSCYSLQKNTSSITFEDSNDPVFFIDSIRVNKGVVKSYQPSEIAAITVLKYSGAIEQLGPQAKNGLVYIETKDFARNKYWNYFRSKSAEYTKLVLSTASDANVQYILNKKVLKENYEADLAAVDDKIFEKIKVITKQQLVKDYGIKDKDFGVVITTGVPADLQNGKSKF